jgi:hypothetical protein
MFHVFHGFVGAAEENPSGTGGARNEQTVQVPGQNFFFFFRQWAPSLKWRILFPRSPMTERSETRTRRRTSLRSLKSNSLRTVGRFGGH